MKKNNKANSLIFTILLSSIFLVIINVTLVSIYEKKDIITNIKINNNLNDYFTKEIISFERKFSKTILNKEFIYEFLKNENIDFSIHKIKNIESNERYFDSSIVITEDEIYLEHIIFNGKMSIGSYYINSIKDKYGNEINILLDEVIKHKELYLTFLKKIGDYEVKKYQKIIFFYNGYEIYDLGFKGDKIE